jgi:hypothetical protein
MKKTLIILFLLITVFYGCLSTSTTVNTGQDQKDLENTLEIFLYL